MYFNLYLTFDHEVMCLVVGEMLSDRISYEGTHSQGAVELHGHVCTSPLLYFFKSIPSTDFFFLFFFCIQKSQLC